MSGFSTRRPPLVFGHRGAPLVATENTIEAFDAARGAGADGVELDARRTADGVIVVHHDATLASGGAIGALTYKQLTTSAPHVATLEAALDACAGLIVNVEIKNWPTDPDFDPQHAIADAVLAVVSGRAGIVVSSFNTFTLDRMRQLDSSVELASLAVGFTADHTMMWIDDAAVRGFRGVHPEVGMTTSAAIARAHDAGLAVRVWTVDDVDVMTHLAELGVDAIITNDPERAVTTLRA